MRLLAELRHRLRALVQRGRMDGESAEEFRFHVEMETEKLVRSGHAPDEARRRALAAFGGVTQAAEAVHDARGTRWLEDLGQDLRYAARQLARTPTFTLVAVVTLSLGIGANTAIFSVVDGVLLRPAPVADLDRLVVVWETDRASGTTREPASWPDFVDYRRDTRTLAELVAMAGTDMTFASEGAEPVRVGGVAVGHDYFALMGIRPLLGRLPTAAEDRQGGPLVALLGERFWRDRFGADPGVLGRIVEVEGRGYTVIGVLPAGSDFGIDQIHARAAYHAPWTGVGEAGVWLSIEPLVASIPRASHPHFMLGRLAPGVTLTAAGAELDRLAAALEAAHPENANRGIHVEALGQVVFGPVRPVLMLLLAAVLLVLLVACVNVANLLLARGARRAREVAVRTALGAGWGRLGRQFVVETTLLSLMGAAVGIGVATLGLKALLALAPTDVPRVAEAGLDGRVLALTLGLSLVVGLGFGLVPTLQSFRLDVMSHVKGEGRGLHRLRLRNALVVTELALSVMLVLSAGLLIRSFQAVMTVHPGFEAEGVLKAQYQLPTTRYPRDFSRWPDWPEIHGFNVSLLARATALPGVTAAAIAAAHPLDAGFTNSWTIIGRQSAEPMPEISVRAVTPGYFATMATRLRRGRLLQETDAPGSAPVGVLNETAARRYFGTQDPLGSEIRFWGVTRRIVGVVADEKIHGLTAATPPAVYVSLAQAPQHSGVLLVRVAGQPARLARLVEDAIRAQDPQLAVYGVEPLVETVLASVGQRRFAMLVFTVFAGLTLVLALVGIYGVLNYATEQRTREIGIRAALGAGRRRVAGLILGQGARLAALGTGLGLAGALAGSRLLRSLLFGVGPADPLTYAVVAAAVMAAAIAAVWIPARRAARIAPVQALRYE